MMVGPSGSGKSMAWRVLLKALERLEGVEGVAHVIDPKVSVLNYNKKVFKRILAMNHLYFSQFLLKLKA